MATFKSTQVTLIDALAGQAYDALKPNILSGRVRCAVWDYKTPGAGAPAVGDDIHLVKLPKGARVIGIYHNWEAMSSAAGTAGADIGDAGDDDRYAAAVNMDAAGSGLITLRLDASAVEPVLGFGYEQTAETVVKGKVTGEAFAVTKQWRGVVFYVVD